MTSSTKTGIAGITIGALLAIVGLFFYLNGGGNNGSGGVNDGKGNNAPKNDLPKQEVIKPSAPSIEAIDRVHSREINALFQMTGKASDADWGVKGVANFLYEVSIQAESKIKAKERRDDGGFKVEEIRTFKEVRDTVIVSDVDFKLALDTLPLNIIRTIATVGGILSPAIPAAVNAGVGLAMRTLDGKGIKDALDSLGVSLPPEIKGMIGEFAGAELKKGMGNIRSINGKSFLITYYNEESGKPMLITFSNEDGSDITNEDELMVLRRANAFINSDLVPDIKCKPGDQWTVDAKDMEELFDPYVDGDYAGSVVVTRKEDAGKGEWALDLSPSSIRVISPTGTTTGSLNLEKGNAKVEPEAYSVNDLFVSGTGNLSKLSKHHLLFTARFDGDCQFQCRIVSKLLPAK